MTSGRVLGLDYGTKRVGVAISDPERRIATPLTVVERSEMAADLGALLAEYEPALVVVGLPVSLRGNEGPAAAAAREFAREVADICQCPVEFYDERFSTVLAERALRDSGLSGSKRRTVVDKVAAAVMLQDYLDRRG